MITFSLPPSATTKCPELVKVTASLAKSKRTVCLVGAGISTSAGIQDFRSPTGLYASTSSLPSLPRITPSNFSATVYASPSARSLHWRLISSLKAQTDLASPTRTHAFFALLKARRQLRRVFSQNIDGLEERAGLMKVAVEGTVVSRPGVAQEKGKGKARWDGDYVALHGDVNLVRCTACDYVGNWDEDLGDAFSRGETQDCPNCLEIAYIRKLSEKRSPPLLTYLRPALVLYDESPPHAAPTTIAQVAQSDLDAKPDFVLVMGTSLKIPGFKDLVRKFAREAQRGGGMCVLVNAEKVGREWDAVFDYQLLGKSDDFVEHVLAEWKATRPRDWVKQATLDTNRYVTSSKPSAIAAAKTSQATVSSPKPTPPPSSPARRPLHALPNARYTPPAAPLPLFSALPPTKKRPAPSSDYTPTPKRRAETFAVVVPFAAVRR